MISFDENSIQVQYKSTSSANGPGVYTKSNNQHHHLLPQWPWWPATVVQGGRKHDTAMKRKETSKLERWSPYSYPIAVHRSSVAIVAFPGDLHFFRRSLLTQRTFSVARYSSQARYFCHDTPFICCCYSQQKHLRWPPAHRKTHLRSLQQIPRALTSDR